MHHQLVQQGFCLGASGGYCKTYLQKVYQNLTLESKSLLQVSRSVDYGKLVDVLFSELIFVAYDNKLFYEYTENFKRASGKHLYRLIVSKQGYSVIDNDDKVLKLYSEKLQCPPTKLGVIRALEKFSKNPKKIGQQPAAVVENDTTMELQDPVANLKAHAVAIKKKYRISSTDSQILFEELRNIEKKFDELAKFFGQNREMPTSIFRPEASVGQVGGSRPVGKTFGGTEKTGWELIKSIFAPDLPYTAEEIIEAISNLKKNKKLPEPVLRPVDLPQPSLALDDFDIYQEFGVTDMAFEDNSGFDFDPDAQNYWA